MVRAKPPRSDTRTGERTRSTEVPDRSQDPAERKRVLNILAQRRYRKRRRERIAELESRLVVEKENQSPNFQVVDDCPLELGICGGGPQSTGNGNGTSMDLMDLPVTDPVTDTELPFELPFDFQQGSYDLAFDLFDDFSQSSTTNLFSSSDLSSYLQHSQSSTYSFPDDHHFSVPELDLLRGILTIAKRLNISNLISSATATSPFTISSNSLSQKPVVDPTALPRNLRPTASQLSLPHHPLLDILPWPTVREKLIMTFSLPLEQRPSQAATPTALADLVYDMEDSSEGVRIWGDDPCAAGNWEVGKKVFERWWWVLDREVVGRSNELRRGRGAGLLTMEIVNGG